MDARPAIDTQSESGKAQQSAPLQVALFGRDPALLHYRNQVLCSTGLITRVIALSRDTALSVSPCAQVAVLCHTLTFEDRKDIASRLHESCPGAKIAAMASIPLTAEEARGYDALIENFTGPEGLIRTVRSLLQAAAANGSDPSS